MMKTAIFFMIIIMSCQLCAFAEIKIEGNLVIPTFKGEEEREYKGVLTIKDEEIKLECEEKIFQPFNEFNAPKKGIIQFKTEAVKGIKLMLNAFIIFPKAPLLSRYRYLLNRLCIGELLFSKRVVFAFVFTFDQKVNKSIDRKVIDIINSKNNPGGQLDGCILSLELCGN